ncbi:uncharacterized protein LOC123542156 [Mercenaria mercenaria]|uniref:uncharacterized protein LOC123542156 n=1 Tax=Mercenaria mercenaria TaxID=6596 RepID=UPI00234EC214|nr:uncharacterized protein LOC123542156 [Mercenaria mercenaria]
MAEGFGGAKPKTRTAERSNASAKRTRGDNSSQIYPVGDMNGPSRSHGISTETCFNNNTSQLNGLTNVTENISLTNNHFQRPDKGAKPKLTKSKNVEVKVPESARNGNMSYGTSSSYSQVHDDDFEDHRLQEFGKLSREKEQEYLSARERWKKSGLALRKYIAEKLGFKQDDRANKNLDSVKRRESGMKRKSESVDLTKGRNNLPRSRSENLKDETVTPRSRSFLRYFGFGKENNLIKAGQSSLKTSKSFEMSSSDTWPESSTDTCKSTSDWSADNTLTNQSTDRKIWTNQKCQGTQTQIPTSCKCNKGTKTKNTHESKHKSKTHKNCKAQRSNKDLKKKDSVSSDQVKQRKATHADKWVGLLDNEIQTSSEGEEEFEYVLDPEYGEIVRRAKTRKPRCSGGQKNARSTDSENTGSERRSQEIRDSTYEALLGLQHAIPYLPENFRNRLQAAPNSTADQVQTALAASSSNCPGEATPKDKKQITPRERTGTGSSVNIQSEAAKNSLSDKFTRNKREAKEQKKSLKDKNDWKKRTFKSESKASDRHNDSYDMLDELERDLENSLEDPFNVRSDSSIDLCSGLMDLVREIDIPFIDEDGETGFETADRDRSARQREISGRSNGVIPDNCNDNRIDSENRHHYTGQVGVGSGENVKRLNETSFDTLKSSSRPRGSRPDHFVSTGIDTNIDGSTETSFEDDPDYLGMRTLNDSFNRLLGDDDTDTSTDSSTINNFLQRTRSEDSGSRSKSSDDSIEADDEFECECDHCQLLRQHNYGTDNLDLLPPRLYTEDMGFPYDIELHAESSASGQNETDSNRGFRSAMFLDDYDFMLDRSSNELDWLIIDSRPLSLMLEDVIQQMLAVQPELLSEQAAPPAPQIVIDNLPTIPLTSSHIVQHPSCPICLCLCEIEELMTLLPCQHIFHPICIQAWLVKSGTCPVCRAKISR